ncbi:MAG TPA: Type 1 glutamine amidotransferase-like domain-containing protein [Candidatus Saccharimonadales bacterium]|jgi:peptidase E|nr:Type 1 glutamine amidotransferase-like domain-containing protein [Candidatus Saccharimonadales bacterium]
MVTKVIISGGFADEINSENSKFFTEILKDTPDKINVLLILFAKNENEWELKSKKIIVQFESVKNRKKIKYTIANLDNLKEQIKESDVVYIRGGDTDLLLAAIKKYPEFKSWVLGKTIAGESAGTYLLSGYFYSKTLGGLHEGLGLLPVKTICHFEGKNEDKLDESHKELKKVLLKDYEHRVFFL